MERLTLLLQATLEKIYYHILTLDDQGIFPHIAYMCDLQVGPYLDYELISQKIFLQPDDYFHNLTGIVVLGRTERQAFLTFLMHQKDHMAGFIKAEQAHARLAIQCLYFLQREGDHGPLGNKVVEKYAKSHWCDHLCRVPPNEELIKLIILLNPLIPQLAVSCTTEQAKEVLEWFNVSSHVHSWANSHWRYNRDVVS